MARRNIYITLLSRSLLLVLFFISGCTKTHTDTSIPSEPTGENNMAYKWGKIALECTANDTDLFRPRPTVTSRMLALVWVSVFDAWSRYDSSAIPFYLNRVERRPSEERTLKNKEIAISYAAYRAMREYFFSDSTLLKNKMIGFGLDPNDESTDPNSPIGIGNLAAKAVIAARLDDGSNQRGTMEKSNGKLYSDYTGYVPVNSVDKLNDVKHWQPKYFSDGKGGQFAPPCLTPHWGKVKPISMDSSSQFRAMPPPEVGSEQLAKELKEVVDLQGSLTYEQKALVEFMRDGPRSVQQAGHWFIFSQDVSVRDSHTLDQDVKMYCVVEMAAMDAFIAIWETKMYYDYARPYTLIHNFYKGKTIKGWAGPDKGVTQMPGEGWRPYSPDTFLCPPFPSYVSGHSGVSGACAEVLKFFTGSDNFGVEVKRIPGAFTEPEHVGDTVVLKFPTFTGTAEAAGFSRVLGGYHIQSDNIEGLRLGRNVAGAVWKNYLEHVNGK